MCNIAGYIGNRDAAPILIDMIKKQSGYNGGYYTGIATIHEGKLYTAKVLGDVDRLLSLTGAINLPGKIGFIHSRSDSGGNWTWAHPFCSNSKDFAYIANGYRGVFKNRDDNGYAQMLEAAGEQFESAADNMSERYPHLKNGKAIHASDLVCHLSDYIRKNKHVSAAESLGEAYAMFPSEAVGLAICTYEPDRISFARLNMPMMLARTESEVFMGTASLSFPCDRVYKSISTLPGGYFGYVTIDSSHLVPLKTDSIVAEITPKLLHDGYDQLMEVLNNSKEFVDFQHLRDALNGLFPEGKLAQREHVVYEFLRNQLEKKTIEVKPFVEPGAKDRDNDSITTTRFKVRLVK